MHVYFNDFDNKPNWSEEIEENLHRKKNEIKWNEKHYCQEKMSLNGIVLMAYSRTYRCTCAHKCKHLTKIFILFLIFCFFFSLFVLIFLDETILSIFFHTTKYFFLYLLFCTFCVFILSFIIWHFSLKHFSCKVHFFRFNFFLLSHVIFNPFVTYFQVFFFRFIFASNFSVNILISNT